MPGLDALAQGHFFEPVGDIAARVISCKRLEEGLPKQYTRFGKQK